MFVGMASSCEQCCFSVCSKSESLAKNVNSWVNFWLSGWICTVSNLLSDMILVEDILSSYVFWESVVLWRLSVLLFPSLLFCVPSGCLLCEFLCTSAYSSSMQSKLSLFFVIIPPPLPLSHELSFSPSNYNSCCLMHSWSGISGCRLVI